MRTGLGPVSWVEQASIPGPPATSAGPCRRAACLLGLRGLLGLLWEPWLRPTSPRLGLCYPHVVVRTAFRPRLQCLCVRVFLPSIAVLGRPLPVAWHRSSLAPWRRATPRSLSAWFVTPPPHPSRTRVRRTSSPGRGCADRQRGPAPPLCRGCPGVVTLVSSLARPGYLFSRPVRLRAHTLFTLLWSG